MHVNRNTSPPWHEHVALANGRRLLIRPIRPADAEVLHAAFALFEPEPTRLQIAPSAGQFSPEHARRLASIDPVRGFALVASEPLPPGQAVVDAVAWLNALPARGEWTMGILVGRHLEGMGVDRHLLVRLVRRARTLASGRLQGELAESSRMQTLARSLGFAIDNAEASPGMVRATLELSPAT